MDYEDNDFQTHTFQLAVEESVKFSPGSHSYSLPKFDVDDNLQVHLRFDSLVESEVLLGIQSHEENQWIEDFSRENSALDFSSGATESCSISRCNNVWSEATSSESVDLLLKSVGQDEMVMEEPIIEESCNCDGLDSVTNQMQPKLNQDGLSLPKSENATCVALSPLKPENASCAGTLETLDEPCTFDKDVVDQLPQIDSTSPNGVSEASTSGSPGFLNSIEDENFKGPLSVEENYNSTGVREGVSLVENTGRVKSVNDPGTPHCAQVNPSSACVHNFVDAVADQLPHIDSTSLNGDNEGFIDGSSGVVNMVEDDKGKGSMVEEGNSTIVREDVGKGSSGVVNMVEDDNGKGCMFEEDNSTIVREDASTESSGVMNMSEDDKGKCCIFEEGNSTIVREDASLAENTGEVKSVNDPGAPESAQVNPSSACVQNLVDAATDQLPRIDSISPNGVSEGFVDGSSGVVNLIKDDNDKGCMFEEGISTTVREDVSLVENTGGIKAVNDPGTHESAQVSPSTACVQIFVDAVVDELPHIDSTTPNVATEGFIDRSPGVANLVEDENSSKGCMLGEDNYNSIIVREDVSLIENTGYIKSGNDPGSPESAQINPSTASVQNFVDAAADQLPLIDSTTTNAATECFIDGSSGVANMVVDDNGKGCMFGEDDYNSKIGREDASLVENTGFIKLGNDPGTPESIQVNPSIACVQNFVDAAADQLPQIDPSTPNGATEGLLDGSSGVVNMVEDDNDKSCMFREDNYNSTIVREDVSLVEYTGHIKSGNDPGTPESAQVNPSTACVQNLTDAGILDNDDTHKGGALDEGKDENVGGHQVFSGMPSCQTHEDHLVDVDGSYAGKVSGLVEKGDCILQTTNLSHDGVVTQISGYEHGESSSLVHKIDSIPQITELSSDAMAAEHTSQISDKDVVDQLPQIGSSSPNSVCERFLDGHSGALSIDAIDTLHNDQLSEYEHGYSSKDADMIDLTRENPLVASSSTAERESTREAHPADTNAGGTGLPSTQILHASDQKPEGCSNAESVAKLEDLSETVAHVLDDGISGSNTDGSIVKENMILQVQGNTNSDDNVDHSSRLTMEMSTSIDIVLEPQRCEDIEDGCHGGETQNADACSPSLLFESQQRCDQSSIESDSEKGKFLCNSLIAEELPESATISLDRANKSSDTLDAVDHLQSHVEKEKAIVGRVDSDSPSYGDGSPTHVLEAGSNYLSSNEPSCGSPTIITCTEASREKGQQERNMESTDHIESDNLEQDCDKFKHFSADIKENDAREGDRSFTFNVTSLEDSSQKRAVSGWNPFPSLQPYDVPQGVACYGALPFGFCGTDGKMSDHGISGESNTFASPECNSENRKMLITAKSAEREAVAEGAKSPENNSLHGVEECQNEIRRSDSVTAVSGIIEQNKNVESSFLPDQNEKMAPEVDRSVAVEASSTDLAEKETCYKWKRVHNVQTHALPQSVGLSPPVHNVQTHALPQPVGVSPPATSFIREIDAKTLQEITRESSPRTSGAKSARRNYKSSFDKKLTSPGKASEKENDKEGRILNETISLKHTKVGGSKPVASPVPVAHVVKAAEKQAVGFTEGNSILSSVTTIQTSSLPDLNSSSSPYTSCHQPFTDLQQVQLRAQIFVYGSIIQGTAPDEACMLAAFGESGGGRSAWETVWRIAVERLHNQKSPLSMTKTPVHSHAGTPVHSHAGARATEATRQTVYRSEGISSPSVTDSSKFSPVVFNPNTTFSSPVWSVSTACRDGSLSTSTPKKGSLLDSSKTNLPLQPFQSPVRQYVGNTSPWLPQAPSPGNWVLTHTAAVNASVHPALPTSETVRVTSIRDSSASHRPVKQHAPVSPYLPPSGLADNTSVRDSKRAAVSPANHASAEPKHRKKARNLAFEQLSQMTSFGQPWNDPVSLTAQLPATAVTKNSTSGMNVMFSSLISESPVVSSGLESGQISFPVQHPRHPVSGTTQSPTFVAATPATSSMHTGPSMIVTETTPLSITHEQLSVGEKTEVTVSSHDELCGKVEQAKRQAEDAASLAAIAVGRCQSIWSQLSLQKESGIVPDIASELESSAVAIAAAASVAKAAAAVTKVASEAAVQAKLMYDEAFATKYGNPIRETSLHNDVRNLGMASILKGRDQTSNADSVFAVAREAARKRVEAASASAKRAENLDAVLKAAEMTAEAVSQAGTIIAMGEPLPFTLTQLVDAGPEGYWRAHKKSSEQLVKSNNTLTEQTAKDGSEKSIGATPVEIKDRLLNKIETCQILDLSKGSADIKHFLADGLQVGSLSNSGRGLEAQNGCTEYGLSKTIGVISESEVMSGSAVIANGPQAVRNSDGNKIEEGSLVEVRSDEEGLKMVWYSAKVLNLKDGKAFVSYAEHARREGSSLPTEWIPLDEGVNAPRIRIPHPMSMIKNEGTKKRSREARGDYTWSVGDKVDAWIRNGWWEGIVTEKGKEDETNLTVRFPAQQETSVVRAWNLRPSLIWEDGRWVEWCRLTESSRLSHGGDTPLGKPSKKSRIECESDSAVEAKVKAASKPPSIMDVGKSETLKSLSKLPSIMEVGKPETSKPLMLSAKDKVFDAGKGTTKVNIGVPKPGRKRKYMDVKQCATDRSNTVSKPTTFKTGRFQGSINISLRDVAQEPLSSKKKSSADVATNVRSKPKVAPPGEKSIKVNERSASKDHLGKMTPSAVEPRRSNRRIQPTSRLLEGLQSSLTVSKIPYASHDKGSKSQQSSSSRGRGHG